MSLESYLTDQSSEGTLESKGSFTLDLSKAADKLAAFALPSESHYLLKMVQVAHHLRAEEIKVVVERYRTVVRFRAPTGGTITDSESIFKAFADPLEVQDPVMVDLVSCLVGTITDQNLETLWSFSVGHSGRRVFIDKNRRFTVEDFTLSHPLDSDDHPCSFTLSVLHPRTWKFWEGGKRRASAAKVLEDGCRFSAAKILLDNRELEASPSWVVNSHLRRRYFERELGYWVHTSKAASNILYRMPGPTQPRFSILRPSLSAYVIREEHMNLWSQGTRVNNTLSPDGMSSAAWMLQFRQDGENISMRYAPKRVPCDAVLALHTTGEGSETPLRLKIVRQGVVVLEEQLDDLEEEFEVYRGCTLIFADHELETDLTGFQVMRDGAFVEKVKSFSPLLPCARSYIEDGLKLLSVPEEL